VDSWPTAKRSATGNITHQILLYKNRELNGKINLRSLKPTNSTYEISTQRIRMDNKHDVSSRGSEKAILSAIAVGPFGILRECRPCFPTAGYSHYDIRSLNSKRSLSPGCPVRALIVGDWRTRTHADERRSIRLGI